MAEPTLDQILNHAPVGGDTVSVAASDVGLWKSLTNFVVAYEDVSDYWRPKIKSRPIFVDAMAKARQWFEERGAIFPNSSRPFQDDAIEVRTYPRTYRVAFFFKRAIAGEPKECVIEYPLTTDMVGWLKATGRWPKTPSEGALN
jgi:hypothetical protein